ncbi:hypothetical protein OPQ81_011751 [Rhizoctonia solani]|nr:hypothetical protein OPQ81_011751 [Rhizoctonia solani]
MLYTIVFTSIASAALVSGAVAVIADAARRCWASNRIRFSLNKNCTEAKQNPSAHITDDIGQPLTLSYLAPEASHVSNDHGSSFGRVHPVSYNYPTNKLDLKTIEDTKVDFTYKSSIPQPTKLANLKANIQALRTVKREGTQASSQEARAVPFPSPSLAPLRASQSEPNTILRVKNQSLPRRITPTKRLAVTQDEIESTPKRQRLIHPHASPFRATSTPLRGSSAALAILSPISDIPQPTCFRNSDSIMSLSGLTAARLADEVKTPEVTTSYLNSEDLDERMSPVPENLVLDQMRSTFDDDVEMGEICWDEDEVIWEVHRDENEVMRDWTDDDVVMVGVT